MPNWVKTYIKASNHDKLLDAMRGTNAEGEEVEFTFNKVLPRPADGDWYSWNRVFWGTKWDCCDGAEHGDYVTFNTAWTLATPYLCALAEHLGEPVACIYADEDCGSNCGAIIFLPDGGTYEPAPNSAAWVMAEMVWGSDIPEILDLMLDWAPECEED